jgi:predicted transcriptional regulator
MRRLRSAMRNSRSARTETKIPSRLYGGILLGPLEAQVMTVAWKLGRCSVRDVLKLLPHRLAYTTVMTTLARLHAKGLLWRKRAGRKHVYWPRCPESQWQRYAANEAVKRFLATPNVPQELLVSSFYKSLTKQNRARAPSTASGKLS